MKHVLLAVLVILAVGCAARQTYMTTEAEYLLSRIENRTLTEPELKRLLVLLENVQGTEEIAPTKEEWVAIYRWAAVYKGYDKQPLSNEERNSILRSFRRALNAPIPDTPSSSRVAVGNALQWYGLMNMPRISRRVPPTVAPYPPVAPYYPNTYGVPPPPRY